MAKKAPGKSHRKGLSLTRMMDLCSTKVSAQAVDNTSTETLQSFVVRHVEGTATVYTDEATAYTGLPFDHKSVKHSVSEFVRGIVHTNGIESFWSMFKRGYKGIYHKMNHKHLDRYVKEYQHRHNIREMGTLDQMDDIVSRMQGKRLKYAALVA